MAGKHYTEEKVAHSLAVLRSNGGNLKRTSAQTGVGRATLRAWQSGQIPKGMDAEVVADASNTMSAKLVEQFARIATLSLAEAEKKIPQANYRDLLIGAGIATEKRELLTGRPTQRSEGIKVSLVVPGSLKNLAVQVVTGSQLTESRKDTPAIEGEIIREYGDSPPAE